MTHIKLKSSAPSGTVRQLDADIETPIQLLALLDEFFRTCTHGRREDVLVYITEKQNKKSKDKNDDINDDIEDRN